MTVGDRTAAWQVEAETGRAVPPDDGGVDVVIARVVDVPRAQ